MGRIIAAACICFFTVRPALAQDASQTSSPSLAAVGAQVPAGERLLVIDEGGNTIKGLLEEASDSGVRLRVGAATQVVPVERIRRVRWQKRDPVWTGVLIGAAIGAAPGIYWLIADPNECTGLCPEEYAFIAAGAAIGGLIDRAVTRKIMVYSRNPRAGGLHIGPLTGPRRIGVQAAIRF